MSETDTVLEASAENGTAKLKVHPRIVKIAAIAAVVVTAGVVLSKVVSRNSETSDVVIDA